MGQTTSIRYDAEREEIVLQRVDSADGSDIATYPSIKISLVDLTGATNKIASFREFHFKDAGDSCIEKKMWILCTEPEAA